MTSVLLLHQHHRHHHHHPGDGVNSFCSCSLLGEMRRANSSAKRAISSAAGQPIGLFQEAAEFLISRFPFWGLFWGPFFGGRFCSAALSLAQHQQQGGALCEREEEKKREQKTRRWVLLRFACGWIGNQRVYSLLLQSGDGSPLRGPIVICSMPFLRFMSLAETGRLKLVVDGTCALGVLVRAALKTTAATTQSRRDRWRSI